MESKDTEYRLQIAYLRCPCRARERIDEVWQALYRMLGDDDVKVRRVAWHTLEDGSKFDNLGLGEIIEHALKRDDGK